MKDRKKLDVSAQSAVARYVDILQNDLLRDSKAINENVEFRQIIDGAGSKATSLDKARDQFDAGTGNIISGRPIHYHEEKRAMDERKEFFIREDLSEWEKIAFASAYFRSGQYAMDPFIKSQEAKKHADYTKLPHWFHITRLLVAEQLQSSLGFTETRGYEMKPEMKSALRAVQNDPQLVNQVAIYGVCKAEEAKLQVNLIREVAKYVKGLPILNKGDALAWIEKQKLSDPSLSTLPKSLQKVYKDYNTMQRLIGIIIPGPGKPAPAARLQEFYTEISRWRRSYNGPAGIGTFFRTPSPIYNLWGKVKEAVKKEEKVRTLKAR